MKKFFQSKGFIVSSLALLCVTILGVCWFVSRDRTGDFRPDESPPSSVTGDWSDGGTQTDGDNGADAYAPGQSTDSEEEYLRTKGELIEGIEDFLFRYCDPEPLTEEGFPIYMLKTKAPNGSCIFLMDGRCSVYPARTRTCRIYPLTVGPGERGRDFEYCLCLDRHRSHFTGSRVSVKNWLYQNFKREDKDYVKREYEIATELGKLMRAIDPAMRQGIVFKVLYYRYYNFDLDQPFQPQYEQNNRHLLADLHRIAGEQ